MKTEVLYVVLNQFGKSWVVKDQEIEPASLADLLIQGWRPVRETPFANPDPTNHASQVLILLERDFRVRLKPS